MCHFICFSVDIVNRLTFNLLTTTIVAPPSSANKWQMGFNSAFKGLKTDRNSMGEFPLKDHQLTAVEDVTTD